MNDKQTADQHSFVVGSRETDASGPEPAKRFKLQILNVIGFTIAMIINATSNEFSSASQAEIAAQWNPDIMPAGWAFAIWGIIYLLLAIFVVYQALPTRMVPSRNDKLIFEDVGYIFFVNILLNGVWLIFFGTNGSVGFTLGLIDIIIMLVTCFIMMRKSVRSKVNTFEFIGMRCGFSMYTGWVTAATFLNVTFMLKSFGLFKDTTGAEETWTIVNMWVAFVIYNFIQVFERNPVYGGVFIWVLFAIKSEVSKKGGLEALESSLQTIIITHCSTVAIFATYLAVEKITGKRIPNWDHGLLF